MQHADADSLSSKHTAAAHTFLRTDTTLRKPCAALFSRSQSTDLPASLDCRGLQDLASTTLDKLHSAGVATVDARLILLAQPASDQPTASDTAAAPASHQEPPSHLPLTPELAAAAAPDIENYEDMSNEARDESNPSHVVSEEEKEAIRAEVQAELEARVTSV